MTLDTVARDFFVSLQGPAQQQVFFVISESVYVLLALAIILLVRDFITKKRDFKFAVLVVSALILFAVVEILKTFTGRMRPDGSDDESFPSRHTTLAFFVATFFPTKDTRYKILLYIWAILIGISRMALNVHWFTDVIAGALIGIGFAWIINKIKTDKLLKLVRR